MSQHDHQAAAPSEIPGEQPAVDAASANSPAAAGSGSSPAEPLAASARNPQSMPAPGQLVFWPSKVFDPHHPPDEELISDCVHCGFCLPTCPTYLLWREEMDSPRGRIYLMNMGLKGEVERMDDTYVRHFDQCLGCMACVSACPSGVKYDRLIESTRAQLERHYRRPLADRLFRALIFSIFPYPVRLRALLLPMWLYQCSGLRWLLDRLGLLKLLPERLRAMEALLPAVSLRSIFGRPLPARVLPEGKPRLKVGLIVGCVQRTMFADVNAATVRVLAAEGCEVVIPPMQGCCGALSMHAGREREGLRFARKMIRVFEREQVDCIAVNAAGCGSNLKDYGVLLRDDRRYAERARRFSEKCKDVTEILAELEPRAERHPLPLRVAYHDSCHLQHAMGIRSQPRKLLAGIPGLELVEVAEAAICCGSAGIYNLVEPGPAGELGERKARNVAATKPDMVVSGNPGCLLQLKSSLDKIGHPVPTRHTIQLLDASFSGTWDGE
jgi:glycolate oxidase iron-sulfur subunit